VQHPPKIFRVNWSVATRRAGSIWPGFAENMRVLQWIVERPRGARRAWKHRLPDAALRGLNWTGLEKLSAAQYAELARVDAAAWKDNSPRTTSFSQAWQAPA